MKKTLLVALLFLSGASSFAQKIRFSDSTNRWHYYFEDLADIPYFAIPYKDTITGPIVFRDTSYQKLYVGKLNSVFYVREDALLKKVYAVAPGDTAEQLLYDFTLNVNDTFRCAVAVHYVWSIDSVLINSTWHRTWYMLPARCPGCGPGLNAVPYYVIEGVGSLAFTCFPLNPTGFEAGYALYCFNNDGTTPALSHSVAGFDNNTSCSYYPLLVGNAPGKKQGATVFPNPITESSKISLPYAISSGSLIITNYLGQAILNTTFQNKDELLIGDKVNSLGIYFYRVTDNQSGQVFSGKFVY